MTTLIPGQNIVIAANAAYRLNMSVHDWSWGVVITRASRPAEHFKEGAGLAIVDDQLLINFHDISDDIEKLIIYVYTDSITSKPASLQADLYEMLSGELQVSVQLSDGHHTEKAITLLEIYQHKTNWKMRSVCQGFNDGLTKLLALYDSAEERVSPDVIEQVAQAGVIHEANDASVTMRWQAAKNEAFKPEQLYVGEDFHPIPDFRIGCFYQLRNGQAGIVHSFDNEHTGSFNGVPYVQASRAADKYFEQLQINLRYQHKLHRYLVFAFMVEGNSDWKAHNVQVDFQIAGLQSQVLTPDSLMVRPFYAVAMVVFEKNNAILTPLNEYFDNLQMVDQAYGWGLSWCSPD